MMMIKLTNYNEVNVLKQVNPLLINQGISIEILYRLEELFANKDLGRDGYVALFLEPVKQDVADILEALYLDENYVNIPDNNMYYIDIKDKEHPMHKDRIWLSYDIFLSENRGKIYVVYCQKKKSEGCCND